jgi:hypothetical protein
MASDKNGNNLNPGDTVTVTGTVTDVGTLGGQNPRRIVVDVPALTDDAPAPAVTISLDGRQTVKVS